jgi:hypothetical protein
LDSIAEWSWTAGDHRRSASERAWAATKAVAVTAATVFGGQILKGASKLAAPVIARVAETAAGRAIGSGLTRLAETGAGRLGSKVWQKANAPMSELFGRGGAKAENLIAEEISSATISASAKGNPSAISRGYSELSKAQTFVLSKLPEVGSQTIVPKRLFGQNDLAALTAATGDEFAMFTTGGRRLIIRGGTEGVPVGVEMAEQLSQKGWRWSAHTHPGIDDIVLRSSPGDVEILKSMQGQASAILNSEGRRKLFNKTGDLLTGWLPR